jgi:hypothetical protein
VQLRVLELCHDRRATADREGLLEVDERLVAEAAEVVQQAPGRLERMRLVG